MSRHPSQPSPSPKQHAVLVFLRAEAKSGRHPSYDEIAAHLGSNASRRAWDLVQLLLRDGFVVDTATRRAMGRGLRLTPKGEAAADAPCPIAPPAVRLTKAQREARDQAQLAPSAPALARPTLCREVGSEPLPPPPLPPLSPTVARFRGIQHPPLPQAHPVPAKMSADTWRAITTIRLATDNWRAA